MRLWREKKRQEKTVVFKIVKVFRPLSSNNHFVSLVIPSTANSYTLLNLFFKDCSVDHIPYAKSILSELEKSGLKCS